MEMFDIPEPCDVIDTVLAQVAKRLHALEKGDHIYLFCDLIIVILVQSDMICIHSLGGTLDYLRAAQHFLRRFREGELGKVTLDAI